MQKFRIVYHTAGGNFRREIEATDASEAESIAWSSLAAEPIKYEEDKSVYLIRPALVAGISIETEPIEKSSERRAGLLGRAR